MENKIVIIMGSESDKDFVKKIEDELISMGVKYEKKVASAHKTPALVLKMIGEYDRKFDNVVYITVAGLSNGLSGIVAANTKNPVIACPPLNDRNYLIDVHSTLRMPSKVPSMCVLNPKNAALAAVRILALTDKNLKEKI
ncbi:MAG: 5-(carboxyamino)imidazole ribonucleotide mutase [Candidatus Nanohalarchaeota archaeon]|nr:MAG: 5-(carboxyamino)imidazole ribonucleotide mutase [Candidatus Nanohaloarchaeota archaeon]